jgi:hypothetical protein
MSELDTLVDQFDGLLNGIRTKYSLEEWRYAYRKIIYSGAVKILREHPEIVIGPRPAPPRQLPEDPIQEGGGTGKGWQPPPPFIDSTKPPYRPSAICELACCIALGTCPPHQT